MHEISLRRKRREALAVFFVPNFAESTDSPDFALLDGQRGVALRHSRGKGCLQKESLDNRGSGGGCGRDVVNEKKEKGALEMPPGKRRHIARIERKTKFADGVTKSDRLFNDRTFLISLTALVEELGARISVESEGKGKGTTYWLRIPTKRQPNNRQSSNVPPLTQVELATIFGKFINYRGP